MLQIVSYGNLNKIIVFNYENVLIKAGVGLFKTKTTAYDHIKAIFLEILKWSKKNT